MSDPRSYRSFIAVETDGALGIMALSIKIKAWAGLLKIFDRRLWHGLDINRTQRLWFVGARSKLIAH